VRTHSILTTVASCFIAVALVSSASDQKRPVNANAYRTEPRLAYKGIKGLESNSSS